jgi:glycolate oxidase iron-sulfur subunit
MMPNINSATARVLDAAGIQTVVADEAGCCGAVKFHLNDQDGGLAEMRANIDAWGLQGPGGAQRVAPVLRLGRHLLGAQPRSEPPVA